jgi:hypothetical protein
VIPTAPLVAALIDEVRRQFLEWGMHPLALANIPDTTLAYHIGQGKTPADIWYICSLLPDLERSSNPTL